MLISSWCSAFHHYLVTSDSGIHHILHSTFADIFLSHWLVRLLKSQQLKDMCKQGFGLVGFWHHRKVPRAPSNTRQSLHGPNYQHHTFTYTKIRQEIKLRVMKSFVEFKAFHLARITCSTRRFHVPISSQDVSLANKTTQNKTKFVESTRVSNRRNI